MIAKAILCFGTPVLSMQVRGCHSRFGEQRTAARIIKGSLWAMWSSGRGSPERQTNSQVYPATIRSNWLSSWIGEVDLELAAVPGRDDVWEIKRRRQRRCSW